MESHHFIKGRIFSRDGWKQMLNYFFQVDITPNERWTTTLIPYRFAEGDSSWQGTIRSALTEITQKTCIRFSENGQGQDYIVFTKGSGCYSAVGKQGGAQEVSIGADCETVGNPSLL